MAPLWKDRSETLSHRATRALAARLRPLMEKEREPYATASMSDLPGRTSETTLVIGSRPPLTIAGTGGDARWKKSGRLPDSFRHTVNRPAGKTGMASLVPALRAPVGLRAATALVLPRGRRRRGWRTTST